MQAQSYHHLSGHAGHHHHHILRQHRPTEGTTSNTATITPRTKPRHLSSPRSRPSSPFSAAESPKPLNGAASLVAATTPSRSTPNAGSAAANLSNTLTTTTAPAPPPYTCPQSPPRPHRKHHAAAAAAAVVAAHPLLAYHANHAEALLSKLRISSCPSTTYSSPASATPIAIPPPRAATFASTSQHQQLPSLSPFASPPPPYSPQHPHIILDHEKLPHTRPTPLSMSYEEDNVAAGESPKPRGLRGKDGDIFHLPATTALTMLARGVELVVSLSGDIPPTPPPSQPSSNVSSNANSPSDEGVGSFARSGYSFFSEGVQGLDGIRIKERNPEEPASVSPPTAATGVSWDSSADGSPRSVIHHGGVDDSQHYGAISRKFWSKSAPEIPIEEYLFRIHRFCPLSTAVYLAASLYLHRLSLVDRIIPLTRLTAHRLVLAALRIASKSLEDLSYPHQRFAKVGGLTDLELQRLEVSFCFLMDFELKVDRAMLEAHVEILNSSVETQARIGNI